MNDRRASAGPRPGTRPAQAPRLADKGTVLIVEDEVAIRDMLGQILADEGYRNLAAADGEVALDVLRRETVDLILLDLMLPRLDGYGVLEALAKSSALDGVPVIILSAVDAKRDRLRGHPVARIMKKPVSLDALLQAIEGALRAS